MIGEKEWNRFIITGKVEDYLKYVNCCHKNSNLGG